MIIENTLQLVGRHLWRTDQETATVVDPAGDERLDESSGHVVVERASDATQLSKLNKAFGTDRGDVLETSCSGNVLSWKRLSGKVSVRETSVTHLYRAPWLRSMLRSHSCRAIIALLRVVYTLARLSGRTRRHPV